LLGHVVNPLGVKMKPPRGKRHTRQSGRDGSIRKPDETGKGEKKKEYKEKKI
jgi:hypothetical protein